MPALTDFKNLSLPKQRVAIAKDVIKQIKKGCYYPKESDYINFSEDFDLSEKTLKKDIKKNFRLIKECEVCALGSVILSCTRFTNELTFSDLLEGDDREFKKILEIFDAKQLSLIEHAFEGFHYDRDGVFAGKAFDWDVILTKSEIKKTKLFHDSYSDSDDRLIAIMENIIKNDGEFTL